MILPLGIWKTIGNRTLQNLSLRVYTVRAPHWLSEERHLSCFFDYRVKMAFIFIVTELPFPRWALLVTRKSSLWFSPWLCVPLEPGQDVFRWSSIWKGEEEGQSQECLHPPSCLVHSLEFVLSTEEEGRFSLFHVILFPLKYIKA